MVDEPFNVTCSVKNVQDNINSRMLEFCIQHPNSSVVSGADYTHIVNSSSAQLVYTLHTPTQNVIRMVVMCFLKNSSSDNCSQSIPRKKRKDIKVVAGCK